MEPFAHVPLLLIALPIALLVLDGIYKWWIFEHAPYDAVADISLAALTFSAVHLITQLLHPRKELPRSILLSRFIRAS